jgi:hypothetical protein
MTGKLGLASGETCFNGWDDNQNTLIDEGCGVDQGEIQFMISWAEPRVDVDLYVTDPEGQIAPIDGVTDLGLSRSLDCPDEKNACAGQNFENVYLEEMDVTGGSYGVRVRVENIPAGIESVDVALGVRLPQKTESLQLTFFRPGQEVLLNFEVPQLKPDANKAKKEE